VVVAAGTSVGPGTIIAANAVVTKDISANVFAAGVPAAVKGPRPDGIPNVFTRTDVLKKKD